MSAFPIAEQFVQPSTNTNSGELIQWCSSHLRAILAPDQVTELRILGYTNGKGTPHTRAGFFDYVNIPKMVSCAFEHMKQAKGVYFTLNPLNPNLLDRCRNRVDYAAANTLAKDKDVLTRRFLLVDADPIRDPHVSATDDEKRFAYDKILAVREHLRSQAWPEPILSDSGNGFHLLYRIDLPTQDERYVEKLLRYLADKFDDDRVKIDRVVHNPARLCKFPWTWARKGDASEQRPHRMSRILEAPQQ